MFVARSGRTHLCSFASRREARRTHRPPSVGPQRAVDFGLRAHVDQTEAGNAESRIALGVSVLSALATWYCARRSRGPEQIGGIALRACRSDRSASRTGDFRLTELNRGLQEGPCPGDEKKHLIAIKSLFVPSSRGDWTPFELFLAGVRLWEANLRRILTRQADDGRP
jgi:hypothetical protein